MSKRREFSAQFKLETVLEGLRGEKSIARLFTAPGLRSSRSYREHEFSSSLYNAGRKFDTEAYPSLTQLEKERGFADRREYGPDVLHGKECDPDQTR